MAGQYWVRGPLGVNGPFDQLQIRGLVSIGQLTRQMEISGDGKTWHVAGTVKGLFSSSEAKTSPTVTPPPSAPRSEPPPLPKPPPLPPSQPVALPSIVPTSNQSQPPSREHSSAADDDISSLFTSLGTTSQPPNSVPAAPRASLPAQPVPPESVQQLPIAWQEIFALIEKGGGYRLSHSGSLTAAERRRIHFSFMAFLFGPLWYFAKGMWRRGFVLSFIIGAAICLLDLINILFLSGTPIIDRIEMAGSAVTFATLAKRDYYRFYTDKYVPPWRVFWIALGALLLAFGLAVAGILLLVPDDEDADSTHSAQTTPQPQSHPTTPAPKVASIPGQNTSVVSSNGSNYTLFLNPNGYVSRARCHMGSCEWVKWLAVKKTRVSESEVELTVTIQGGESSHAGTSYPASAEGTRIDWVSAPTDTTVLCSRKRPSVGPDVLPFSEGEPLAGYWESVADVYFQACHSAAASDELFERLGYARGEPQARSGEH
jgi:hypothetical protein